jgi:hypothetical protein
MIESLQQEGAIMADGEKERTARNRALLARMGAAPTKAQVVTELDLEINDAINLAVTADLPTLVRLLRMAKLEVVQIQRRSEFKDKCLEDATLKPTTQHYEACDRRKGRSRRGLEPHTHPVGSSPHDDAMPGNVVKVQNSSATAQPRPAKSFEPSSLERALWSG